MKEGEGRCKSEEYINRKSRKQRGEADVSIFITITITIIIVVVVVVVPVCICLHLSHEPRTPSNPVPFYRNFHYQPHGDSYRHPTQPCLHRHSHDHCLDYSFQRIHVLCGLLHEAQEDATPQDRRLMIREGRSRGVERQVYV